MGIQIAGEKKIGRLVRSTLEFCFILQASFLEIYNEEIRDLLAVEKDLKYEVGIVSCNCTKDGSNVFLH